MIELHRSESQRDQIQQALDAEQPELERNRLGQFATPPELARQIAEIALSYLDGPARFLEPSIGAGAFFEALLASCPAERIAAARGVEIDPRFAAASRRLWGGRGLEVVEGDFCQIQPRREATLILANPPYTRHHHLSAEQKAALQARLAGFGPISGLAGLYLYFVLLADAWAAPGCVSAWLLPSEWMDVNYGAALKSYLTQRVQLLRLHRFRPEDVQFGEALVTSSVLFFRHGAPEPDGPDLPGGGVRLTSGSLLSPALDRRVPIAELGAAQKWGARFAAEAGPVSAEGPRLGDLLSVRRGIATGANGFFVRPRSEFRRIGVADRFLRPAVPAPRDLAGGAISAAADGWPDLPDPPALLDVRLPEASLAAHPAIHALLTSAEAQEIRAGYLCAHRSPWYLQEQRPPAAILASYMGRSRDGAPPIRFVRNRSDATPTNNWLLLSPTPAFIARYPDPVEREAALDRLCGWLSGLSAGAIVAAGRTYGGGLSKLEPKELAAIRVAVGVLDGPRGQVG